MSSTSPVLIIDNGGYSLKALYIPDLGNTAAHPPRQVVVPNCVGAASFAGRGIVGEQLFKLPHFHGFMMRRPVDRGFIVDVALQSYIWEYLLQFFAIADEREVELVLTVPFAAPKQVGELLHYLVAQRFHFHAVTFVSATFASLVAAASREWLHGHSFSKNICDGCGMVIDFGFSATTIMPYVDFFPLRDAAVRVDVGGKVLSNRLKEHISFTQMNMTEDGWLVNYIMERCCYVALEPLVALKAVQRSKRSGCGGASRYYLPTVPPLMPLGCREEELPNILRDDTVDSQTLQYLVFRHEAFLIPELLFQPADVGIYQMGVVEAVVCGTKGRGILQQSPALHKALLYNLFAFGGTANFPNLRERLSMEMQRAIIDYEENADICSTAAPLQPLVERHSIVQIIIETNDSVYGNTIHDSELQPLYGALALLTCPFRQQQLHLLQSRCRVDLSPPKPSKAAIGRAQTLSVQKTLNAIQEALQNLL